MHPANFSRQLYQLSQLAPTLADQAEAGQIEPAEGLRQILADRQPRYDLCVAVRKFGRGSTADPAHPVTWVQAGQNKPQPLKGWTLARLAAEGKLDSYFPVGTEVREGEIVHRYIRKDRQDAPLRVARAAGASHRSKPEPNLFYQDLGNGRGCLEARWTGNGLGEWKPGRWGYPPESAGRI